MESYRRHIRFYFEMKNELEIYYLLNSKFGINYDDFVRQTL
jgi:hypothetical protein